MISLLLLKYPNALPVIVSPSLDQGWILHFIALSVQGGCMRGRGIPMLLYMLCCLLEYTSLSCPLTCLLVIIKTTLISKVAKIILYQTPC